jgi:hypothetical protein
MGKFILIITTYNWEEGASTERRISAIWSLNRQEERKEEG